VSGFDLSQFLASFFDEAGERLASINQKLVAFEAGTLDAEGLIALRRDAHTIKGSALMLGIQDVGNVGHLFEDAMEYLIDKPEARTPQFVQFLFDLHDRLQDRFEDQEGKNPLDVGPLRAQFDELKSSPAAKPASVSEEAASFEVEFAADALPEFEISEEPELESLEPMVIGADDVEAWKIDRQTKAEPVVEPAVELEVPFVEMPDLSDPAVAERVEEGGVIELTGKTHAETVAEAAAILDDPGIFRPDVSQVEMKTRGQRQASGRFLRVDAERVEGLSNQVIELSTEKSRSEVVETRLREVLRGMRQLKRDWGSFHAQPFATAEERQRNIKLMDMAYEREIAKAQRILEEVRYEQDRRAIMLDDLRDQVLGLMLRPLDSVFSTFPRAVRDIAVRSGKQVRLLIGGESVEMDQTVAESLVEPLVHLLNNAIAHGIETPEQRKAAGKPEEGQVTILARQSGSEIRLEIIDDGVGISVEKVKSTAIARGVTTQYEADAMSTSEILEMIFRPGFSTRDKVDDISGRGIGMNVVQDAIRKLTGNIRIHTEEGKGTRFIISLPVSIAVQHALLFRIGGQKLGMLSHMIEQVVPLKEQHIEIGEGDKSFIRYGNRLVPLVDLRMMLDDSKLKLASMGQPYVIIAEHIEGYVGIVVSELFEEVEIIIRDIDPYLKRYQSQGLMGNTIVGDGSVLLLIEPYGIKEMGRTAPDMKLQSEGAGASEAGKPYDGRRLMLVDDSIIARQVEKALFETLGFTVDTAIDGLDALEKLRMHSYEVIVTDLEMPRLDGFGLVRQLRNVSQYEDMPILIISTRESAEDRMRALEAGADAYLVKQQLEPDGLLKTMQGLIEALTPVA